MNFSNDPKDDAKYQWTNHVKDKMRYYRISESMVKRIVRFPERLEEGIAPNTVAAMQSKKTVSRTHIAGKLQIKPKVEELWVMYVDIGQRPKSNSTMLPGKKKIITAWRYPGQSPIRARIPIPDDILMELESID